MIQVIASICVVEGEMDKTRAVYDAFVPEVLAEEGCLKYQPTIDCPTDIGTQLQDPNTITVIEAWESMEAFRAHLNAPHVLRFRENVKGLVEKVSIKVLRPLAAD